MAATFLREAHRNRRALIGARILVTLVSLLVFGSSASAQRRATTQPAQRMAGWVDQLADPDALVRERARDQMLGLTGDDLPTLRKVLAEASTLMPTQKSSLREIVAHVYLSSLPYERAIGDAGFLGVKWPDPVKQPNNFNLSEIPDFTAESFSGVVIARRLPGFPAYRTLRDGDIVTRLVDTKQDFATDPTIERKQEDRLVELLSGATPTRLFINAMTRFKSGDAVRLDILRNGRSMTVRVELAARPAVADQIGAVEDWVQERADQADKYWDSNFGSIMKDDPTPISMAR